MSVVAGLKYIIRTDIIRIRIGILKKYFFLLKINLIINNNYNNKMSVNMVN